MVRICISLIFSLIMVGFAWGLKQTEKKKYKNLLILKDFLKNV